MRQKIAALLAASLLLGLCAGCGASEEKEESADTSRSAYVAYDGSTTAQETAEEEEKEEKVFVIYCIGEDFKNRVQDYYPGYEVSGEDSGRIGDVRVQWNVYSDAQEYREDLDERLDMQADRDTGAPKEDIDPNEKVDLFVVDEAFLRDYVESAWSLDVKAGAGLTEEELSDQFLYTQQMATDAGGKLKAVSWQATPGVFAYRRSIAKEVLGTDDPEKVQEAVSDWESFAQTAQTMKEAGYYMLSSYGDAYRVYADNVTSAWVEDGASGVMSGERTTRETAKSSASSTRAGASTTRCRERPRGIRTARKRAKRYPVPPAITPCAGDRSRAITADSGSSRRREATTRSWQARS